LVLGRYITLLEWESNESFLVQSMEVKASLRVGVGMINPSVWISPISD
jgi:hypothetical protein